MVQPSQDRLIRKEVSLRTIREILPPSNYRGLQLVPFMDVASDDVIFDFAKGLAEGLAPARAEDAESELAQKDLIYGGTGRARILDWAQKDHYDASDVGRWNELALLEANAGGLGGVRLPLTVTSAREDMRRKMARDDLARRRRLDARIEWLIFTALSTGGIAYNDGKVKFTVDFGRPAGQHDQAPPGGTYEGTTHDPIGDVNSVVEFMDDTYGVAITRAVASKKILRTFMNSERFLARLGLVVGGTPSAPIDPAYIVDGWNPERAIEIVERATGVRFMDYDAYYRTRPIGSTTTTRNRFFPEDKILFLPSDEDVQDLEVGDGQSIGFAKTLTSPHIEGNWEPGFYEWEKSDRDPWGVDRGTGIKALPVFPHMDLTFTMTVLP